MRFVSFFFPVPIIPVVVVPAASKKKKADISIQARFMAKTLVGKQRNFLF